MPLASLAENEDDDPAAVVAGADRFDGLLVGPPAPIPPRPEGGAILPDAGRRGRAAVGRCLGGSSRSSVRGSFLLASSFWLKKLCTRPICDGSDSTEIRGYCGGGWKRGAACVELRADISKDRQNVGMKKKKKKTV